MIDIPATQIALSLVVTLSKLSSEEQKKMYKVLCEFDKRGVPPQDFFKIMKILSETEELK